MVDDLDEVIDDELDGGQEDPLRDCTSLMDPSPVEIVRVVNPIRTLMKKNLVKEIIKNF